jgi:hypothetical protein
MTKLYGIYSEKQKREIGSCLYTDENGGHVEVTEVSREKGCPSNFQDDKVDRGVVVEFVRKLR